MPSASQLQNGFKCPIFVGDAVTGAITNNEFDTTLSAPSLTLLWPAKMITLSCPPLIEMLKLPMSLKYHLGYHCPSQSRVFFVITIQIAQSPAYLMGQLQ